VHGVIERRKFCRYAKGKGGEEMGGGEITGSAPAYSKFCSHLLLYFTITAVLYHDGIMQFLFQ